MRYKVGKTNSFLGFIKKLDDTNLLTLAYKAYHICCTLQIIFPPFLTENEMAIKRISKVSAIHSTYDKTYKIL